MAEPPELQTLSLSDRLAPSNDDDDDDDDDDEEDDAPAHWTFLEILDLLRQYAVPSIDLWARVGTVEDVENTAKKSLKAASAEETTLSGTARHYSHALGGGYSAIVLQHTTIEDVLETITDDDVLMRREPNLVTRAGTVVAFKKISPRPPGNSESQSSSISEAFRTICQEIGVCRHPLLRNHENIGKILYVAWERLETFPWLALELAAFGTLEDVLTAPGEGPTLKQKLNLTIDIAVGLAALHKAGIVHGDLKPANILVQKHAERQIVGQLSDFGGSASLKRGAPSIGTPLWLAPEACTACQSISWMPADTWSFGLVVASIWCHEPHRERTPSSCYLENLIPKLPDTKATDARILLIKTEHDLSPDIPIFYFRLI
ncbi:hypothetical protein N0V95_005650 [Ascochyta clinopodiicola]|nr:hypothetical protein N0V95_005650 [Ascochyta clinopodiicola]